MTIEPRTKGPLPTCPHCGHEANADIRDDFESLGPGKWIHFTCQNCWGLYKTCRVYEYVSKTRGDEGDYDAG